MGDGQSSIAREHAVEPPLPPALLATAHLALGNGLQLERLTRPDEIDVGSFHVLADQAGERGELSRPFKLVLIRRAT